VRYGDRGAQVVEVQRALMAAGYALPRYGADGVLGDETWGALERFAHAARLAWTPEVPPPVVEALVTQREVVDLRSEQTNPPVEKDKWKIDAKGKVVVRAPASVSGVMLHQTAVFYGVSSQQQAASGGDRHLALHRRGLNVACHAIAFDGQRAGVVCGHGVATAPVAWYCYQANTANAESLGLEIEGAYPGTVTPGCVMPSQTVIDAARAALRYLVEEGRREGMPIRYVWAHRQSSASRRGDPGEALWKAVALEYGVKVLGLETQPARTWGDGRPIPVEWQPDGGVGRY